jgi:hypothetical protein
MKRELSLDRNVIRFCRHLRSENFRIGPSEAKDALEALYYISWDGPEGFRSALKSTLAKDHSEYQRFDPIFNQFWKELLRAQDSKLKDSQEPDQQAQKKRPPSIEVIKDWLHGNQEKEVKDMTRYSPGSVKSEQDFSMFANEDLKEWTQIILQLKKKLAREPNRRFITHHRKGAFNLRAMIRKALRQGGEYIELSYRRPKPQKLRIALICDVSRSMELYSRMIINLLYSFQNSGMQIETFVFSTSLYRVTPKLKNQPLKKALKSLSSYVDEWSGGTRIGACLAEFNERYAKRIITPRTYVFILSDGWDSGETHVLEDAIKRIKKGSRKVIWMNPLAGNDDFKPEVKGLQVAMPYIDALIPVNKVGDLRTLVKSV